ncbi:Clavaminate synthase-like protein [Xylariaceae sp. FL0016]|nr:Clavaminate synthase-like protein [Xylariaceae sp. FL0016]
MPHKETTREFTPAAYPEFPEGFPTVELQTISLAKLLSSAAEEEEGRVFEICKGRGFFYLDLAGCAPGAAIAEGAEAIARVGEDVFRLPMEEKVKYKLEGRSLDGYKTAGATVTDKQGTPDTAEFFNVGKNEMIVPADRMRKPWPREIVAARPLFAGYVRAAHGVGMRILAVLAGRMGVGADAFARRHRIEEMSGDHVRITRGPPRDQEEMPEIQTPSHTDFGTITILMNWLGGLQVWSQSARKAQLRNHAPDVPGEWLWVRPRPGCAIVNLGDAAVKFTNGLLCSGRHRVIPAPGAQGKWPRYSIVYFVRPEDACVMKRFQGEGVPEGEEEEGEAEITARDWIYQQTKGLGLVFEKEREGKKGDAAA